MKGNYSKDFEECFNEYYVPVLRYCSTIVDDLADAKDIVQQVFIKLWEQWDTIHITVSARAYLYKSVHNAGLNFLKHEKVKQEYVKEAIRKDRAKIDMAGMDEKELQEKIDSAISKLPKQCERIFRLSRVDKLKYREIAATLNISEKTVENQMGKALSLLRSLLKEYLPMALILIQLYNAK